jgi:hypothetical protein
MGMRVDERLEYDEPIRQSEQVREREGSSRGLDFGVGEWLRLTTMTMKMAGDW